MASVPKQQPERMTSPTPARLRGFAGSPRIPPLLQSAARATMNLGAKLEDQFPAVDLIHLLADVPKAKSVQDGERRTVGRCHAGEDCPLARVSSPLDEPLGGFRRVGLKSSISSPSDVVRRSPAAGHFCG